jgi:hypothetical protein
VEYPRRRQPWHHADGIERDLPKVEEIVAAVGKVLDQMSPVS